MVCVTTSATLVSSVLQKAGQSVMSEFGRRRSKSKPVLLNGGHTSAQKILFIPWEFEVGRADSTKAQKVRHVILVKINRMLFFLFQSLSNLVKQCIDDAHKLKMTSIAFPSVINLFSSL